MAVTILFACNKHEIRSHGGSPYSDDDKRMNFSLQPICHSNNGLSHFAPNLRNRHGRMHRYLIWMRHSLFTFFVFQFLNELSWQMGLMLANRWVVETRMKNHSIFIPTGVSSFSMKIVCFFLLSSIAEWYMGRLMWIVNNWLTYIANKQYISTMYMKTSTTTLNLIMYYLISSK